MTASPHAIDALPTVRMLVQTAKAHTELQCTRLRLLPSTDMAESILGRVAVLCNDLRDFFALYESTVTACSGRPLAEEEAAELARLRSALAEIQGVVSTSRDHLTRLRM